MDLSLVPLLALSTNSKTITSTLLNPIKVLPSNNGLPRDWRGLVHVFEITSEIIPLLSTLSNPFDHILEITKNTKTLKDLQNALDAIERWDVFDDTEELFEKDAQVYVEMANKAETSAEDIIDDIDLEILTIDDQYRSKEGLRKQCYDAFLLYADEDYDFAIEMVKRMEKENLKICTKDRDLIAGGTLENEVITKLISSRCNRLIIVVTPDFLKSPANTYFLEYARAVGIDRKQRKLIACIYKDCEDLPESLNYTLNIYYSRRTYFDFWGKLCESVRISPLKKESQCGKKGNWKENYVALHKFVASRGTTDKQIGNNFNISLASVSSETSLHSDESNLIKIKKTKKKKFLPLKLLFRKKKGLNK